MTTAEKIEIMQAYEDGEQIEVTNRHASPVWYPCIDEPDWDWGTYNYRIKPEPTYRPYKDLAEFRKEWEKHGGLIIENRSVRPCSLNDILWAFLFYRWADDGSPCGVLVEEGGKA